MRNQNSTADVLQLRNFPASLPTVDLQLDSKHVDKGTSQVKSPWDSIFSNASFSPPMLSDEEREKLLRLTTQAAESLKSRNPLMDDCIVDAVAPQLACLLAMPVPSGQSKTKTHLGSSKSPLERCKSGDTSLELRDLVGHVEEFSFDQQGNQFLQERLEMATNEERNTIFREILPIAMNLMIDMFGNLVIQKYFDFGSLSQIRELANVLLGNVVNLSLHKYGSDVLQTALEVVDMDKRVSIAKELDGHVIQCSCDQYGSHVVAKIIECVPEELIGFLISSLSDKITSLSVHPHAYHIIQMLLECCDEDTDRVKMLSHVLANVYALSHDQYGNYVIQYILENGRLEERSAIIRTLSGKILAMSKHKHASNVIEKSLRFGGPQEQHRMVDEIMMLAAGHDTLQMMVHDQYGNHLVQTALEVASTEQFTNMVSRINRYLTMAQIYSCEPNVLSMIERLAQQGEKMIEMRISKASQWA